MISAALSRFLKRVWPAVEHWVLDDRHLSVFLKSDNASLMLLERSHAMVRFTLASLGEQESRLVLAFPGRVGVVTTHGTFDLDPSELQELRLTYVI